MTRDDVLRMAMEAGLYSGNPRTPGTGAIIQRRIERFAALVAAHEREECAKVCDEVEARAWAQWKLFADPVAQGRSIGADKCADAIRARGNNEPA